MFHCLYTTLYVWLQNLCIYLINNVINLYVFIITNFVYNETPLPESSTISKKLSRKNWSLHFSIANIRLPRVHLSWPGTSALSYWSLLPCSLHSLWREICTWSASLHLFLGSTPYTDLMNPSVGEPIILWAGWQVQIRMPFKCSWSSVSQIRTCL